MTLTLHIHRLLVLPSGLLSLRLTNRLRLLLLSTVLTKQEIVGQRTIDLLHLCPATTTQLRRNAWSIQNQVVGYISTLHTRLTLLLNRLLLLDSRLAIGHRRVRLNRLLLVRLLKLLVRLLLVLRKRLLLLLRSCRHLPATLTLISRLIELLYWLLLLLATILPAPIHLYWTSGHPEVPYSRMRLLLTTLTRKTRWPSGGWSERTCH
jgi:hypothetical protein